MTVPSCSNCRALLPAAHLMLACPHCGTPLGNAHVAPAVRAKRRENLVRAGLMIFAVAFVAVPMWEMLHIYVWKEHEAAVVSKKADDLHTLGARATEVTDLPEKALGALDSFDPVGRADAFVRLAGTWSTDARLTKIDLHGVRKDGTLNVSPHGADASARYQFASSSRAQAARLEQRVADTVAWSAIEIELKEGALRAYVIKNASEDRAPAPLTFGCALPKVLDLWHARGLPLKDTYDVELVDQKGSGTDYAWQSKDWGVPKAGTDCRLR